VQPQRNKVVVHYADGKLVKGYTHDFLPERESFHLNTAIEPGTGTVHEVEIAELKAVFFVKTFEGNMTYREKNTFEDVDAKALHGIKIKITFKDGEILRGISLGYSKAKRGFFVVPIDPQSNNERIFIVATSTTEVVVGPNAEK
jgi:hypothetical protein